MGELYLVIKQAFLKGRYDRTAQVISTLGVHVGMTLHIAQFRTPWEHSSKKVLPPSSHGWVKSNVE